MKCSTCGNDNPADAQFCGGCGASLDVSTTSGIGAAASALPMVKFPQAIKLGFKNYFKFSGRAPRAEFWWFLLFTQLIWFITLVPIIGLVARLAIVVSVEIALLIATISLTSRRFHDIGESGLSQLLFWVPLGLFWANLGFISFVGGGAYYWENEFLIALSIIVAVVGVVATVVVVGIGVRLSLAAASGYATIFRAVTLYLGASDRIYVILSSAGHARRK